MFTNLQSFFSEPQNLVFTTIFGLVGIILLLRYIILKNQKSKYNHMMQLQMIEQVNDSIISTDMQGNILSWNNGSQKILGYTPDEVIGKHMSIIHREEDIEQNKEYAVRLQEEGTFSVEAYLVTKDKEHIYAAITLSILKDENSLPIGLLGISKDISQRKYMEDQLQEQKSILDWQAHHDSLTNLPNRVLFYDRLEQGIKRSRRNDTHLALFFLDLDYFKEVNDTLGHEVGDALLKEISKLLRSILRDEDTLSRLGGDEFTVIIKDLEDVNNTSLLAEKIINILSENIKIKEHIIKISCSIGIAVYPQDATTSSELLKNADIAMYKAKDAGKNNFKYYS